jgi:AraC-like DNA-binding protein
LVLKNARESQTVPAVARVLGVSRSTLERVSRSCLRLAPGLLIDLVRIRSIARDLRDTHDSAKSIAWGHSYTSPSNMTRRFLEFTGVTPVAYRHCWRLLMGAGEQK